MKQFNHAGIDGSPFREKKNEHFAHVWYANWIYSTFQTRIIMLSIYRYIYIHVSRLQGDKRCKIIPFFILCVCLFFFLCIYRCHRCWCIVCLKRSDYRMKFQFPCFTIFSIANCVCELCRYKSDSAVYICFCYNKNDVTYTIHYTQHHLRHLFVISSVLDAYVCVHFIY